MSNLTPEEIKALPFAALMIDELMNEFPQMRRWFTDDEEDGVCKADRCRQLFIHLLANEFKKLSTRPNDVDNWISEERADYVRRLIKGVREEINKDIDANSKAMPDVCENCISANWVDASLLCSVIEVLLPAAPQTDKEGG